MTKRVFGFYCHPGARAVVAVPVGPCRNVKAKSPDTTDLQNVPVGRSTPLVQIMHTYLLHHTCCTDRSASSRDVSVSMTGARVFHDPTLW